MIFEYTFIFNDNGHPTFINVRNKESAIKLFNNEDFTFICICLIDSPVYRKVYWRERGSEKVSLNKGRRAKSIIRKVA